MSFAARFLTFASLAVALAGCGNTYQDQGWRDVSIPFIGPAHSGEEAMSALARGDFAQAEAIANRAISHDPKDPYALLALAVVYQNTDRKDLARHFYEGLVEMNPQETALVGVGAGAQRRTIGEIASQNLAAMKGRPMMEDGPMMAQMSPEDRAMAADGNIILRFQILRRLLDEGLITKDEYNQRRGANLGALLRYSAPPGATELDRPPPSSDQVVHRLRYLAAAFEEHSISAREQEVERSVILDALMPARPMMRTDAPPPVTDQLQAASLVGRLERMSVAGVIDRAEQNREKTAIFTALSQHLAQSELAARAASGMMPVTPMAGPGVYIATYHSKAAAERAWSHLKKRFSSLLGSYQSVITAHSLHHRTSYRLNAGPMADERTAAELCRGLRHRGQSCEVATIHP